MARLPFFCKRHHLDSFVILSVEIRARVFQPCKVVEKPYFAPSEYHRGVLQVVIDIG